jgi:Fic family protein
MQREIERLHAAATLPEPASPDFIRWLHREFYRGAAPEMLRVAGGGREFTMVPGEFRTRAEHDVAVGRHVPPSSAVVPVFMDYFAVRFQLAPLGQAERIVAAASAHHRFNYIHPFPDGNGRVSRLMSHAMAHWAGIGARGLWSVSRGLARGLSSRGEYKSMLDHADAPRAGDLDGRGNLSDRALADFVVWFLRVCRDQIEFMSGLFDLDEMRQRLRRLADARNLPDGAASLLEQVWLVGALPRGAAARASGFGERKARGVLAEMLGPCRMLASDSPKGAVYLHFSIDNAEILFPRLFPEA